MYCVEMKTLVTGATGFIGSNLVKELLKDGKEVRILARKNSDKRNITGLDIEVIQGDIRDKDSIPPAIQGCYSHRKEDAENMHDINVEGTKNVLNAALEHGVEKVVHTSTIGTIGRTTDGSLPNEETPFNQQDTASDYVKSKHLAEVEAVGMCEKGLPVVVVNPTAPIGAGDIKPSVSGQRILECLDRRVPAYPEEGINWVHVRDVARGHILAAEKGRAGERYILGNKNLSLREFLELMEKAAGVKAPEQANTLKTRANALATRLTGAKGGRPPDLTCDCSKALRELNLPQTPLEDAVREAVAWFRENGYIT
jgi:dihydroflavonol-4-reductase